MDGMSEEKGSARPRQVTMAVVMGVISSIVLVLGIFDTLARLRTPAMREVVGEFLAEAPGSSLGLDTAQVVDWMRALAFASGALAAMGLVFAIFVLQRHRAARVGFTVVAVLLLLTVPVAGLMPLFLAAAAFLLWSQPARDWYAGRVPVAAGAGGSPTMPSLSQHDPRRTGSTRADSWSAPATDEHEQPRESSATPVPQDGSQQHGSPATPPPYGQPYGGQPYGDQPSGGSSAYGQGQPQGYGQPQHAPPGYVAGPGAGRRPKSVTIAAMLTWIGAGSTALLMLVFIAVLSSGGDAFVAEFEKAARESDVSLSADEVLAVGWAVAGTMLVWSLISIVLAILAFRRSNAARIALAVSAVMAALLSLVAIMSILSVVTLLLAGAAAILLFSGGANQWYSRRSSDGSRPGPPSGYPYAGYPHPGEGSPGYPQQTESPQPPKRNQPW